MFPGLFWVRIPTWLAIFWRKYLAPPQEPTEKLIPGSAIIFRLDQLGDVVLTTPLFRELKRHYPSAHCTVVVRPEYREILTTNPNVDEILVLRSVNAKWLPAGLRCLLSAWRFYRTALSGRRFDLAISPRWDVDDSLATMLCTLTDAAQRVGYTSKTSPSKAAINRGFDAAFDVLLPSGPCRHEVERNLAIVEALGGGVGSRALDIRVTERDRSFARELLTNHDNRRRLIAIGIGGRAGGRKWPLRNYAECIRRLDKQRSVQPLIVCSADEDSEAVELSAMLPVSPYVLSGLPLRRVCAVLQRCHVFIGNDSGAAHLAAAMDCPVVVVSRHPMDGDASHANSPVRFGPWCRRSRVLQPPSGEGGCKAACRSLEPHCILQVTIEQVVKAVHELLPIEESVPPAIEVPMRDELHLVGITGPA